VRYPQAQPRTAPPTRVDGSDVTMDQEVPHAGTPMAVPINFRFMRSSVDTDASIRIPMRRAADHRSDNKGSPMDGHTQSALMARVVASMFVTCIRASHPGAATTFRTRRTRLRVAWAWPWQTLPCARWSVSVEGHGLFHEWCYPAVLGARRLCRTAQPTG
jgi:hypothetical protein